MNITVISFNALTLIHVGNNCLRVFVLGHEQSYFSVLGSFMESSWKTADIPRALISFSTSLSCSSKLDDSADRSPNRLSSFVRSGADWWNLNCSGSYPILFSLLTICPSACCWRRKETKTSRAGYTSLYYLSYISLNLNVAVKFLRKTSRNPAFKYTAKALFTPSSSINKESALIAGDKLSRASLSNTQLRPCLHQASASTKRQRCHDAGDTALIGKNGVASKCIATPFWDDSICFHRSVYCKTLIVITVLSRI